MMSLAVRDALLGIIEFGPFWLQLDFVTGVDM